MPKHYEGVLIHFFQFCSFQNYYFVISLQIQYLFVTLHTEIAKDNIIMRDQKKIYEKPLMRVVKLQACGMLAQSGSVTSLGPGSPFVWPTTPMPSGTPDR